MEGIVRYGFSIQPPIPQQPTRVEENWYAKNQEHKSSKHDDQRPYPRLNKTAKCSHPNELVFLRHANILVCLVRRIFKCCEIPF
jgi:hypothetical protein